MVAQTVQMVYSMNSPYLDQALGKRGPLCLKKTVSRNANISVWHSFPSYSIKIEHLSIEFFSIAFCSQVRALYIQSGPFFIQYEPFYAECALYHPV